MLEFCRRNCKLHQNHLIHKKILFLATALISFIFGDGDLDLPGFYSCVATFGNTLREWSADIASRWRHKFPEDGPAQTKKLPPRPISQRWGAVCSLVEYYLANKFDQLTAVFASVLGTDKSKQDNAPMVDPSSVMDETALDDTIAFKAKRREWINLSLKLNGNHSFRLIVELVYQTLHVLQGIQNYLCSSIDS